ncbi:POLR3F, partial [Symbiodinium sp. KB8]
HRVVILRSGTGALFYKLNEAGRAMKLQDILPEEQLVLQHVEKAGNKGVWLKILRLQTRLQSAQLKKILKNLAKRKLVKSVKSITAYREVWVAWGVEPDKTVTGGKWYTDSKLDTEFITHLSEAVYVALQSGPRSRAQLLEMLAQVGVSSVALTPSDVQDILDILVYDGMVEEMPTYVS